MKKRLAGMVGRVLGVCAVVALGAAAPHAASIRLPRSGTALSPQDRASLLVSAMTLDQKIAQLHGRLGPVPELPECGDNLTRQIPGIPALQIPTFRIANGAVGIGGGDCSPQDQATALPSSLGLAASFDTSLATTYGDLMGKEARALGLSEIEGPGMNLARVGEGGRNFEYLGEDPYLAGTIASSEIKGIQRNDVLAMAKHYVLNEQEANRNKISVQVDDRTLHELYLLPFEMAVKDGHVASIMCSYNRIGATYACDDPYTLTTVLRDQWGFRGYVQSDFGATHSTAISLNAGEDLEMFQGTNYSATKIKTALANGSLTEATIDKALKRRYTQMFTYGLFDRPIVHGSVNAPTGGARARTVAEDSAVLLKNEQSLLPIDASKVHSIALIGQSTFAGQAVTGGGGSSHVVPPYTVSPLQGLRNVLAKLHSTATVEQVIVGRNNSNLAAATAAAARADMVIVMAGVITDEGHDRTNLSLPNKQDALISAVAAANSKTAVVLKDSGPVLMPWLGAVPAVLEAWYPGQEDGNAVADLLFGLANPSGKLPVTYPATAADTPTALRARYPGVDSNGDRIPEVYYTEGLAMGYRWYESQQITPLFPFGYGLSYTTFQISDLVTTRKAGRNAPITVQFAVRNTGAVAGSEVAQVYLGLPAGAGEPAKRLVGFQKVSLRPGQEKVVTITIDPAAANHPLSIWNDSTQSWRTVPGDYQVYVGDSSVNTPLSDRVTVR